MTKATGLWSKIKKTVSTEIQDDEKLTANLAKQDLCVTIRELIRGDLPPLDLAKGLRGSLRGSYIVKAGAERISDFKHVVLSLGKDAMGRLTDKRLLRSAALFVGSVLVMRNFGELMAV